MSKIRICDIAEQVRGVSYKPCDIHSELNENSVMLLRANNISDGKINFDDVVYVDKSRVSQKQFLRRGDILVCASSGSKDLVGKAASIDFDTECTFGAFCKAVRPNAEYADYLGVYFQSNAYRRKIFDVAIGANINNIKNEHIDLLEIPTYDKIYTEQFIAQITNIQNVIDCRKKQLAKLDELVKARFAMHTTSYKATMMSETRSPLIYDYNVLSRKKLTQQRFPSGLGSAATPMPIITKSGSIRFS